MSLYDGTNWLASTKGVSTTVGDVFVPIPSGAKGVIFDKVTFTNASVDLSTSTTTAGLYTASAAGGTAICTAATGNLTPLSATTKYKDGTIAASADAITLSQQTSGTYNGLTGVFVRTGGTNNVAGTFDVYIGGRILT